MISCCCIADGDRIDLRGFVGRVLYMDREGYALVDWAGITRSWHRREDLHIWDVLPMASA